MVSPEILAAQQAYAARPFSVRWRDSHFSGTFRFETLDEAYDYIQEQWARQNRACARKTQAGSWVASCLRESYLETPAGRCRLDFVLLASDVSNRE